MLQRNLRFLEDYLALDPASINQQSADTTLWSSSKNLRASTRTSWSRNSTTTALTTFYALIPSNRIYIDLHAAPLAEPDRVRGFSGCGDGSSVRIGRHHERPYGRLTPREHPRSRVGLPMLRNQARREPR